MKTINPMNQNEYVPEEEITEEETSSGSGGNAKAAGKVWDTGAKRGKANPISNHGEWESGVVHGKANPVKTMGESDDSLDNELSEIKKWMTKLD
jgi:hypothetical protein